MSDQEAIIPAEKPKGHVNGRAATPEAEAVRRARIAAASMGNAKRAYPWVAWLKRGILKHPEDIHAVREGEELRDGLISDKGGEGNITAAESTLVTAASRLLVLANLAAAAALRDGVYQQTESGTVEHPGIKSAVRFASECRQHLALLGLGRRQKNASTLADILDGMKPASEAVIETKAGE